MGPETTPVLVVLHADTLTENSAHVLSKANIGDLEMGPGITVVVSSNIIRIGQNTLIYSFSEGTSEGLDSANHSHFGDITAEYSIQGTKLLAVRGHHAGASRQAAVRHSGKTVL